MSSILLPWAAQGQHPSCGAPWVPLGPSPGHWPTQAPGRHLMIQLRSHNRGYVVVQRLSHVRVFLTPWAAACQGSLSSTVSQSLPKLTSIEWVMPNSLFILSRHLLLLPWIFPSIRCYGCPNTCSKSQAAYGFRGRGEPCSLSGGSEGLLKVT